MIARLTGDITLNGTPLIAPFDLRLPVGWSCVLGPSGCGKTTILRILAGLASAAQFDGTRHAPRTIAYLGKEDSLIETRSVLDNALLGCRLLGRAADADHARAVLADLGLGGFETRAPATLSAGQRARVALARSVMMQADLVLLDEPFSALDTPTRAHVQNMAYRAFRGAAVVLVTHDPFEALRLGNYIYMIKNNALSSCPALPISASMPHDITSDALHQAHAALLTAVMETT